MRGPDPAAAVLPNSPEALERLVEDGRIPRRRVWAMLALRSAIGFALLASLAGIYALAGTSRPFEASSAWWLHYVTVASVVSVVLMARLGRREGLRLRDIYFLRGSTWRGDLLWALASLVVTALVAQAPGEALARLLWGSSSVPNNMLFGPLPPAAVYPLFALFPIAHALAELPIYWGYVAPRLKAAGMNRALAIAIVGSVLSAQHLFLSFQPDWRYCLWLGLKFLPFALWTGIVVDRRPTTLPYLMGAHLALDSFLPYLALLVSKGTVL